MKKVFTGVTLLVILIGIPVVRSILNFSAEENERTRFLPYINQYIAASNSQELEGAAPYVRGKLLTIDTKRKEVDIWTYPKLSQDLRAETPEEVSTVALITWDWEDVGHYKNVETGEITGAARKSNAQVTLLDWKEKKVIWQQSFAGEAPPDAITRNGDFAYERPMFTIVQYLENLPRQ